MTYSETAFFFPCGSDSLLGMIAVPEHPAATGVVIVVGGPQYRVGSHRQFTLLARSLADRGIASMRFDYRGMGDSTGEARNFEDVGVDIGSAIGAFLARVPAVRRVVLWGLCDGASASCFYAPGDDRVAGIAIVNPWIRTERTEAKAYLRQYYGRRLLERDFWRKVARGGFRIGAAARSLASNLRNAGKSSRASGDGSGPDDLPLRVIDAIGAFRGPVLVLLSGNDIVAAEFKGSMQTATWKAMVKRRPVEEQSLEEANHTFAREEWRDAVGAMTAEWIHRHFGRTVAAHLDGHAGGVAD